MNLSNNLTFSFSEYLYFKDETFVEYKLSQIEFIDYNCEKVTQFKTLALE